jgi:hypothetical protein
VQVAERKYCGWGCVGWRLQFEIAERGPRSDTAHRGEAHRVTVVLQRAAKVVLNKERVKRSVVVPRRDESDAPRPQGRNTATDWRGTGELGPAKACSRLRITAKET